MIVVLEQINERAEWLAEMEELGHGKKYRDEIREQISERLRHIRSLERKSELRKKGIRYIDWVLWMSSLAIRRYFLYCLQ